MLLSLCTWPEVEAYLKTSTGIIVPIGSTEQHGPTGLIGTDAICAEAIARGIGERTGAMVAPVIAVGMAAHHMAFAGSLTLRPSTLVAVIRDTVLSLAEHGFTRILFVNGHGGNIATVRAAFYEIHDELRTTRGAAAPDLRLKVVSWWENEAVGRLSRELFGDREGSHATPSEVAVTQHLFPDAIKPVPAALGTAPRGAFHDHRDFRRRFPDGRIGSDPSLARPEHGKRLMDAAVAAISEGWAEFLSEP
ncbi:creatininase family protein [Arenibaculum pallidiluteum]|uniref:creatininase family protein n=1 Tax=Arenibaculum pallidiluteum TaxID=2812559 RepID=UPI001A95B52F|nr:creatininase family protein [Arenibaculum pallidiluteum]